MVRYVDKIIIQINGHDHHADLRYHKGLIPEFLRVSELDSYMKLHSEKTGIPVEDFTFNNMLINPALTSLDGTNPGFSLFRFDATKEKVHNLEMHYLEIRKTYNLTNVEDITNPSFVFELVDFFEDYGVKTIDSKSLLRLTNRLEDGGMDLMLRYITDKAGFNSSDRREQELVVKIYTEDGLIGDSFQNVRYICIQSEGLTTSEVKDCWNRKNVAKL